MKVAGIVALLAVTTVAVSAQLDTPSLDTSPTPDAVSTGSQVQMNFGSDSDGGESASDSSATASSWFPTPTISTDAWNLAWNWQGSSLPGSSVDGIDGWPDYEDDVPIEVTFPGLDGAIDAITRDKYVFDKTRGFELIAQTEIRPGHCPFESCIHLVFESDYGAMTPFDAFVLDRYESAAGPVTLQTGTWNAGGPLPFVLGRLSEETRARIQGDSTDDAFNWKETRRTIWTLQPTDGQLDEIDVTLSLKQLYTLLPGYTGPDPASDGPFYSADITDQVIIRVNAQVASPFAGASAMLPIVVQHTGSQLVDIDMTSSLLYEGVGVNGGNEIQLTFTLSRRKYGGMMPWFPAKPSRECEVCATTERIPNGFQACLDDQLSRKHLVFEELLSFNNDVTEFDLAPFAEACFSAIATGDWTKDMDITVPLRVWNDDGWTTTPIDPAAEAANAVERLAVLRQTDKAFRCWSKTQCAIGGGSYKSDAQVVVLRHSPARAILKFHEPTFSFSLQMKLEGHADAPPMTTPVMSSTLSKAAIADAIESVFTADEQLDIEIEVLKYDNTAEIAAITAENTRLLEEYNRATQLSNGGDGTNDGGDGGTNPSSDTTNGSMNGTTSDGGPGGDGPFSPSSVADAVQPPTLKAVPPPTFTVEVITHSIVVAPYVHAVLSDDDEHAALSSVDRVLQFSVAPLDVAKFQYVAPPQHVDLSWQEEPPWISEVRRRLPVFTTDDSCTQCKHDLEACLFDLDCAYGVDNFLAAALDRTHFASRIQMVPPTNGDVRMKYQVDVTSVLKDSKPFFPAQRFEMFKRLVSCWAVAKCDLDEDRQVHYTGTDGAIPATPTTFVIDGTRLDVVASVGETLTIVKGGRQFNFPLTSDASALGNFLHTVVVPNSGLQAVVEYGPAPTPTGARQFSVVWPYAMVEDFSIAVQHATSSVTVTPATVVVQAERAGVVIESDDSKALQWPRLKQWLDIFKLVPSSSFPSNPDVQNPPTGGSSGGSSSGSGSGTAPTPDPSTPPSAVCGSCSELLKACASDGNCAAAVRAWLPALLPSTWSFDTGDVHRAVWNPEVLNGVSPTTAATPPLSEDYRVRVLKFASCIAARDCPVGVSQTTTATSTVIPTLLDFEATRHVSLPPGDSHYIISYGDLNGIALDESATGLAAFLKSIETTFGEKINFVKNAAAVVGDPVTYDFTGSWKALNMLTIVGFNDAPGPTDHILTAKARFECLAPGIPNWDYFLGWFGLNLVPPNDPVPNDPTPNDPSPNDPTPNDPSPNDPTLNDPNDPKDPVLNGTDTAGTVSPCPQCLPKLQACYLDAECWSSVQEAIVPLLSQHTAAPSLPSESLVDPDTGHIVYTVNLGSQLYERIVSVPPALATAFKTPASWNLFTDILTCFGASACDVETMNSALEPPATAHIPSFLMTTQASAELLMYLDSQLRVEWKGQNFEYMELATGTAQSLTSFLTGVFVDAEFSLQVALTLNNDVAHAYTYKITFGKDYFGRLPQFSIFARGDAPPEATEPFAKLSPWTVHIVSTNQLPQWDLLTSLLSSPSLPSSPQTPPSGSGSSSPGDSVFACPNAVAMRGTCYASYECQSLLTIALPLLEHELQTAQAVPVSHATQQVFELDLSWLLVAQIFPGASRDVVATMMDVLRESALCAKQSLATSASMPVFDDLKISFRRPPTGPVSLYIGGSAFELPEALGDPQADPNVNLENFVINHVIAQAGTTNTRATHAFSLLPDGVTDHTFEFSRLYISPPPHLFAEDMATMTTFNSIDKPWKLAFQSPSIALNDAFTPWLAWLSTPTPPTSPPSP